MTSNPQEARDDLIAYAATTRTVTADGLAPLLDAYRDALLAAAPAAASSSVVGQTTRDRIADVAKPFFMNFSDEEAAKVNAGEVAAAVVAVLPPLADWDALVAETDRLRREGVALHERAVELDAQVAALQRQVAQPADRTAVLREAADGFDRHAEQILDGVGEKAVFVAKALRDQAAVWREAAETLRRLADEAQQPEVPAVDRAAVYEEIADRLFAKYGVSNRAASQIRQWAAEESNAAQLGGGLDRGTCPVCEREYKLTGVGLLPRHWGHVPDHRADDGLYCLGVGERPATGPSVADEAQQSAVGAQASADLIEDYLRFLRGQGPEPDLSDLAPQQREAVAGQFEIVKALTDRDPELPPLDRDPVALRLGLLDAAPAAECSAQHRNFDDGRLCIRAAQHRGDHIDERGFHWSDTVAVYPVGGGTFRSGVRLSAVGARQPDTETPEPVSPAYARLQAAAHKATEAAHLHAMHGMKRTFQLALRYGNQPIPAAEVLNALGLDENANTVEPAAPAPVPDPTWPRRAWDLGLLHKGGDPHHCPACVAQPEPPKDFICPGAEANAEVLANPQPAASSAVPGRSAATDTHEETHRA